MRRPDRSRLQLGDCPPDPKPYDPALGITAFEHLVGSLRRHDFGIFAVLPDKEVGRAPDVDVWSHREHR